MKRLQGWRLTWVASAAFVVAFLIGVLATQGVHAFVGAGDQSDAMIDAVSSSGPAAGAVVILAFVIKAWLADMKDGIKKLTDAIADLVKTDLKLREDFGNNDLKLREEFVSLKTDQRDVLRRLARLERKLGSGVLPKAEDE